MMKSNLLHQPDGCKTIYNDDEDGRGCFSLIREFSKNKEMVIQMGVSDRCYWETQGFRTGSCC